MRRPIVRFRALGLTVVVVLALAASALWIGSTHGDAGVLPHRVGPVLADLDRAVVVVTTADARATSGWIMPLAALGAAVAVALRHFARRELQLLRATYPVRQRLVRASRRAPPLRIALHSF